MKIKMYTVKQYKKIRLEIKGENKYIFVKLEF
jgi:hypothetical protein